MKFVYRSHYAGPLSKRIVSLKEQTVLGWFQRGWKEAVATDPYDWVESECGGHVYGLASIFEAAQEKGLPVPATLAELEAVLHAHLYVEGGRENIRLEDGALRVLTDDDEVELAYFFFEEAYVAQHPARLAYLLNDDFPLPTAIASGAFAPGVQLQELRPPGEGEGTTFAVLLTFYDGQSIPGEGAFSLSGVRVPGLCDWLRKSVPPQEREPWDKEGKYPKSWPLELRLLRAMVSDGDVTIEAALQRVNSYPLGPLGEGRHHKLGLGLHSDALPEFEAAREGLRHREREPQRSVLHVTPHCVQVSMHTWDAFGFSQWFLFDDLWASAQPQLAASLLRYGTQWDPMQ